MRRHARVVVAALAAWCALGAEAEGAVLCSVSGAPPSFAPYQPTAGAVSTASGSVTVVCTIGGSVTIALSSGNGTVAARRLLGPGGATLGYNLYTDAALATIWGDGTLGTSTVTQNVGTLLSGVTTTIYGAIPAGQDVPVGTYSSTVTITISF